MGRSSKFSFPLPGRKSIITTQDQNSPAASFRSSSNVPKAQRILGTDNDLNIDSQPQDGLRLRGYHSRKSSGTSGMSVSISDSTQSTWSANEKGGTSASHSEQ